MYSLYSVHEIMNRYTTIFMLMAKTDMKNAYTVDWPQFSCSCSQTLTTPILAVAPGTCVKAWTSQEISRRSSNDVARPRWSRLFMPPQKASEEKTNWGQEH